MADPSAETQERRAEEEEERICRFCFEGADCGELISPCSCTGGQKYVHLACLRMWQRAVLSSQATHPDFYDIDTRQRVCNVCKQEFSCPPPTRAELLESFTGSELAALIGEGSLIGSTKGFSSELESQLAMFPEAVQSSVACRHWIRGVFLITKVAASSTETLLLRVDSASHLSALIDRLGPTARRMHIRGRQYRLLAHGPLASLADSSGAVPEASAWREAIRNLVTPASLCFEPEGVADCGDDGIVAVNLTRPFDISERSGPSIRARQRAFFCPVMQRALTYLGSSLAAEVSHFVGGPCEEDEVAACMVVADGEYILTNGANCLSKGLQMAARMSKKRSGASAKSGDRTRDARQRSASKVQRGSALWAHRVAKRRLARLGAVAKASRALRPASTAAGRVHRPAGLKMRRLRKWAASARRRSRAVSAASAAAASSSAACSAPVAVSATDGEAADEAAVASVASSAGAAASSASPADASSAPAELSAPAAKDRVRLFVFWGYAGWSRCQLMGEIARGSWGLCQASPADVALREHTELYEAVYPRMMMAPKNDMSENYGGDGPEVTRRRELRRMAIFHQLLQRQRAALLVDDSDDSEEEEDDEEADALEDMVMVEDI